MVVQRKNLLEAFRHAGSTPTQEPEPSAGPFAASPPRAAKPKREKALAAPAVPVWVPWAFGVALAFVFGVAIGRSTARVEAGASEEQEDVAAAGAPEVRYEGTSRFDPPAEPAAEDPGNVPVPLLDARNRYTIIVAAYGVSRKDYAMATMQYLYDQGFDVMPLAELNDNILVLVGAAPTSGDLRPTLDRLTRLAGTDGTPGAFADAYPEQIDRLIDR